MKLHATANDLLIEERERLISGSVNIYTCEFTFDESWDGYTVTAVFSTGNRTVMMAVIDGECKIPVEVLRPNAKFRVGIVGVKGKITKPTTYSDWVRVEQGASTSSALGSEPTQSVFEQWMQLVAKAEEWANVSKVYAGYSRNYAVTSKDCADISKAHANNSKIHAGDSLHYAKMALWYAEVAAKYAVVAQAWADKAAGGNGDVDGDGDDDTVYDNVDTPELPTPPGSGEDKDGNGVPDPPGEDKDENGLTDTPDVPETPEVPDVPGIEELPDNPDDPDDPGNTDDPDNPGGGGGSGDDPNNPGGGSGGGDEGGNDVVDLRLQKKNAVPDCVEVVVEADDNYDALSKVIIEAESNLKPWYIREGVTMFGVTGTMKVMDEEVD